MRINSGILGITVTAGILFGSGWILSCTETSDDRQRDQQEKILLEATAQVGMPAIKNFREKKLLKDIYELRDQSGLTTYTYVWNELNGKSVFLCDSVGYGIPYATQFTNPQKIEHGGSGSYYATLPQADPNGLFSPASADGTWIMCKNPNGTDVKPVFIEPRVIVSPFKITPPSVDPDSLPVPVIVNPAASATPAVKK